MMGDVGTLANDPWSCTKMLGILHVFQRIGTRFSSTLDSCIKARCLTRLSAATAVVMIWEYDCGSILAAQFSTCGDCKDSI